ncbi:MAG: helix-turn-helix transcriptional regulator [Pseudoclavibacter sp.]
MYEPDNLVEPVALWVQKGTLHLTVRDDPALRVDAGSGIWLPAGTDHDFWTDPDTIVLPLWDLDATGGDRENIHRFDAPTAGARSLIDHYTRQGLNALPQLAEAPSAHSTAHSTPLSPSAPPTPRSGPSARVAAELTTQPALDLSLEEWARWAACSPNTLRRSFLTQTGITFSDWRQQARLARAVDLLSAGLPVGHVAAEVGYASRWGFTSAFRSQFGTTPREAIARLDKTPTTAPPQLPSREQQTEALSENVMVWVRDGELHARFDDRPWIGEEGDVMWLPAGTLVEQAPRAALSLSALCTECVQLERPQRALFSRAWDEWLLWASASTNTLVRPAHHHGFHPRLERPLHAHVIDAFETQVAVDLARSVPMPDDALARAAATRFLRTLGTSAEAAHRDLAADVRVAFEHDTGLSFAQWRLAARMRIARKLLQEGVPASSVSSRVGYTMLSNFSRAFSRFHDIGPREFQALEGPDGHRLFT